MNIKNLFLWVKHYWLEALLVCVALGNAEVWHEYMTSTGSIDTWQLTLSIYATELVIVSAGLWGFTGLCIATAMFAATLVAIESVYVENWIGHSYLALTIWLGTIGNYTRRKIPSMMNKKALGAAGEAVGVDNQGILDHKAIAKMSVVRIMQQFNITKQYRAHKLQQEARAGKQITMDMIKAMQQ